MENALSLIQQPKPEIKDNSAAPPKRTINRPQVGVISLAKTSNTPISDTLILKEQEMPRTAYKLSKHDNSKFSMKEVASVIIAACGISALGGMVKGAKGKK